MSSDTNTATLFLERKPSNDWKKIDQAIKNFFDKPKDTKVNGIDKAFSKYVAKVFEGLELDDYFSLIRKKPNKNIQRQELFSNYIKWFNSLTEVKQLKEKKSFKYRTIDEQKTELNKLFYEKIFAREQDRILYFFLVYSQQTVLIKVGEKQAEKDFIGYEFSSRRGHEGIKMYRNENGHLKTKLYDEQNHLNKEKASSYVYMTFLKQKFNIEKSLNENISSVNTLDLLDFRKLIFEKSISFDDKKKVDFNSVWGNNNLVMLSSVAYIQKGTSITKVNTSEGKIPVIAGGKGPAYYHNESNRSANVITVSASGAYSGFINYWEQPIFASDCNTIISKDEKVISTKLIYHFLKSIQRLFYSLQRGQAQPHVYASDIEKIKIPLPPTEIQEKIISEINVIEQKEKARREKLSELNDLLIKELDNSNFTEEYLSNIVTFKNGLNYRRTSSGDIVNIVGVKDFQNNFRVDINSLDTIQIEGKLTEEYKLIPGDILVVRSNGSANLVGRFLYVEEIMDNTSFSGFTIRLRKIKDNINTKYLCYCLKTQKVRNMLTKDSKGSNIKSLNQTLLSSIKIPFPPIDEQEKIIKKIEAIEKEISVTEKDLVKLDSKKEQILIKYLA